MPPRKATASAPEDMSQLAGQVNVLSGRVDRVEKRMDTYEKKVDDVQKTVQHGAQTTAENNLLLHKLLLAVQGQREPGLETPGLLARFTEMEERLGNQIKCHSDDLADLQEARQEQERAQARRNGYMAGAAAVFAVVSALLGWYFSAQLHHLFELLNAKP
jgi:chromosome segregation ATPase